MKEGRKKDREWVRETNRHTDRGSKKVQETVKLKEKRFLPNWGVRQSGSVTL